MSSRENTMQRFAFSLLLLTLYDTSRVQGSINMFHPEKNVWNTGGTGFVHYNGTEYSPTCGWKIILRSAVDLGAIEMSDAESYEPMDNNTFILTCKSYMTKPTGRISTITLTGNFNSEWQEVFVTWYCVCNESTGNICQNVSWELPKFSKSLSTVSSSPVVTLTDSLTTSTASQPVSEMTTYQTRQPPPTFGMQTTTEQIPNETEGPSAIGTRAATTVKDTATPKTNTPIKIASTWPKSSVEEIYRQAESSGPCRKLLERLVGWCYYGALYTSLKNTTNFVDCCSLCCSLTACQGINFYQANSQCDLVYENVTAFSDQLAVESECIFWRVTYSS